MQTTKDKTLGFESWNNIDPYDTKNIFLILKLVFLFHYCKLPDKAFINKNNENNTFSSGG